MQCPSLQLKYDNEPPQPKKRPPCWPFDRDQAYPDATELARLRAIKQDSEEWMRERQKRLGASSCSDAVGLTVVPRDFWRLKTHRIEKEFWPETQAILERGHRLEPVAAEAYELAVLRKPGGLYSVGIVVHPELAWLHASPDRLIRVEPHGIVEIKAPVYCIPEREVPPKYMCQVQQQMACMGPKVEWCDLFYYLHDDEEDQPVHVKCWRIWRNPLYWGVVLQRLRVMADCLQEDRPPTRKEIHFRVEAL
jgi:putative phage-type endonuclease